jgi:hypothetical protein
MNEIATPSANKPAIQFGILFGVLMVLEFVIGYTMDIDPATNPTFGWTINILNYFVFPLIFIWMGCNAFKKSNNGFATFGQCIKIGVVICVIAALIYSIFFAIFTMIFPDFIPELLEKMKSAMIAQNPDMPQDQIDTGISFTEKFMKPYILIPGTWLMYTVLGLIWSLIVGAIVKKDRPVSF